MEKVQRGVTTFALGGVSLHKNQVTPIAIYSRQFLESQGVKSDREIAGYLSRQLPHLYNTPSAEFRHFWTEEFVLDEFRSVELYRVANSVIEKIAKERHSQR